MRTTQVSETNLSKLRAPYALTKEQIMKLQVTKPPRAAISSRVASIADLRSLARRRLPKAVFDYLDGGAEGEVTLRENCRVFEDVTFRARQAVTAPGCELRTRFLGSELSFPALLAPIGYSRLMHPGGEVASARATGLAGTAYILSTISGHRLEDVKASSSGPVLYQLYLLGGREAAEGAIERAQTAGFSSLVVTIDTPVAGMRERDSHNGVKELLGDSLWKKAQFVPHAPQLAHQFPAQWRRAKTAKRCHSGPRSDAPHRCECGSSECCHPLGRFAVDSRSLARLDCGE